MKTIYKYPLAVTDSQVISLPAYANILDVQNQGGTLCLWALVDPKQAPVERTVLIIGTGHPIATAELEGFAFLGTVQQGPFVWHVFVEVL